MNPHQKVTWKIKSELEDEDEVANLCFMAKSPKGVNDLDLFYTYDELGEMLDQVLDDS